MADQVLSQPEEVGKANNLAATLLAAADQKILSANGYRRWLLISNDGAADAWLSLGTGAAVAHKGVYLRKEGGVFTSESYNGEIHAISTAGTTLCICEAVQAEPVDPATFTPKAPDPSGEAPGWSAPPSSFPGAGE